MLFLECTMLAYLLVFYRCCQHEAVQPDYLCGIDGHCGCCLRRRDLIIVARVRVEVELMPTVGRYG